VNGTNAPCELFEESLRVGPANIREHMILLSLLASQCNHVTEFGTSMGISTSALLLALPRRLITYDIIRHQRVDRLVEVADLAHIDFSFRLANTAKLSTIEETDMLFIDSAHVEEQLAAELAHAHQARRYLVFHDVETFGIQPEVSGRGRGLVFALLNFLRLYHDQWEVQAHYRNNNGLTVLRRR